MSLCPEYKCPVPVCVDNRRTSLNTTKHRLSEYYYDLTVDYLPVSSTHWASRVEVIGGYHEYTDVKSCQDVVHLYHLLWSATILNIVALFLGIITAAVLGGFKDMASQEKNMFTNEEKKKSNAESVLLSAVYIF